MPAAIPQPVQPVLDEYLANIQRELPGYLVGFYLHGSIALGEYQPRYSDVDFIAVISRISTPDDIARLTALHAALKAKYPEILLSGSYLQPQDLGQLEDAVEPAPYFQDGVLQHGRFDLNAVTWWTLKTRGITLLGTPADQLDLPVDMDRMIADMRQNLNSYWVGYIRQPMRMAALLTDWGIQWAIPGVLRQFHTFRERSITSKTGACEYALLHVPERWHRIIQEAINVRNQRNVRLYRAGNLRVIDALLFLLYIINRANSEA